MELLGEVSLRGIRPETVIGMIIVSEAYKKYDARCQFTSITDGQHSVASLHYVGFAFDCRTISIDPDKVQKIVLECKRALNSEWDVVLEDDHLHVEYQPKRRR